MNLDMEFIRNKSNLVEIHIIPIQIGVTKMYGMHEFFSDRDTCTHEYYGIPMQSDNSRNRGLSIAHDFNAQNQATYE